MLWAGGKICLKMYTSVVIDSYCQLFQTPSPRHSDSRGQHWTPARRSVRSSAWLATIPSSCTSSNTPLFSHSGNFCPTGTLLLWSVFAMKSLCDEELNLVQQPVISFCQQFLWFSCEKFMWWGIKTCVATWGYTYNTIARHAIDIRDKYYSKFATVHNFLQLSWSF